jgi:hypothetical protein
MIVCLIASPENSTCPHLWPIVSIDEKTLQSLVAWEKNYATCSKHVSLIHPKEEVYELLYCCHFSLVRQTFYHT